jgi:hypothetical protein
MIQQEEIQVATNFECVLVRGESEFTIPLCNQERFRAHKGAKSKQEKSRRLRNQSSRRVEMPIPHYRPNLGSDLTNSVTKGNTGVC